MKYLLITILATGACFLAGVCFVSLFTKKRRILRGILAGLVLLILVGTGYLMIYARSGPDAQKAMKGSSNVHVHEIEEGYFFDGPGEETALIFYPGAKVETEAYAPLLLDLAEEGIDTFLIDMPMRMAFFDADAAGDVMEDYTYDQWVLGGHSLGGTVAASYAADHPDEVDGLVLLAAYPTQEVSVPLLSIYGTEDGCLDAQVYEEKKELWPEEATEVVIEGGNHAQFGDYGEQRGDEEATISPEEQVEQTTNAILSRSWE